MGLLDSFLGRSRPKGADLDALFALPNAAITLETTLGYHPSGSGSVCYRAAEGVASTQAQTDIVALLDMDDGPDVERSQDPFGYTWLTCHQPEMSTLCTDLHAINTSLEAAGFGSSLLCSLVTFTAPSSAASTGPGALGLVYLYKQGTFYPFCPTGAQSRDNLLEIQVRDALTGELPLEKDLGRWLALWGAPGTF